MDSLVAGSPGTISEIAAGRILRLPEVCSQTGLGRSMIYQLEAESRFPGRIKISARAVGWLDHEIHAWIAKRVAYSRRKGPVRSD